MIELMKRFLKRLPITLLLILVGGIIYFISYDSGKFGNDPVTIIGVGAGAGSTMLLLFFTIAFIASLIGRGPYWGIIVSVFIASIWEWSQAQVVKEGLTNDNHGIVQGIVLSTLLILPIFQIWGKIKLSDINNIHLNRIFKGRVGRLQYFGITSVVLLLGMAIMMVNQNVVLSLLISLLTIPITVKRLHDIGLPGYLAPIGLLSYLGGYSIIAGAVFNIFLFFKRGDAGDNKFGVPFKGNITQVILG